MGVAVPSNPLDYRDIEQGAAMKRIILFILIVFLAASFPAVSLGDGGETIVASGTIEAETVIIASEIGARVIEITVDEGEDVDAGQILLKLDDSLLVSQRSELEATINTAQANLDAVKAGPTQEKIAAAKTEFAQAKIQRDGAYKTWQQALKLVVNPQPLMPLIRQAQAQVQQAEGMLEKTKPAIKTAEIQAEAASRNQSDHAALVQYDIAKKQLAAAKVGQKIAEEQLKAAKIQLAYLWDQYTNPIAFQTAANQAESAYYIAEAAVSLAEAKLNAASAQPRAVDIAAAEAQLRQAQSALALFEAQASRYTITAPRNGLITTRVAQPGELAMPGATLLTLADLDTVTLKVFIPETQIGQIKVGQSARVSIDSMDTVFAGKVSYIANEAEFTPKNVQTQEERVNLVFAVEITLDNPDHILKPGMPADAEILP